MSFVYMVISLIVLCNLAWLAWGWWQLRVTRRKWAWRAVLTAFVLGMLASLVWVFWGRRVVTAIACPLWLRALTYIWNLIVLPLAIGIAGSVSGVNTARAGWKRWKGRGKPIECTNESERSDECVDSGAGTKEPGASAPRLRSEQEDREPVLSRRRVLAGAVAAPPVLAGLGLAKAMWEIDALRVREIDVALPNLPRDLDGVSLAHVTDTHVGRYTHGEILRQIARKTNELRCEAVLFTGDLIDGPQRDVAEGAAMLNMIDRPVYVVEGNHDLFDGRASFEAAMVKAGRPLLLNESSTIKIRGVPVQVLGIRWGSDESGRDPLIARHVEFVSALRDPDAFQILLSHHPHAFDHAAELGIPLTLAGHTHGGQLMLTPEIGVGPMLFKYWTGLYKKRIAGGGESALVVSNGAGNWFPLRLSAPAEIVKITLRRA